MALQSKLFGGDPKLEAAAVSDPAHIIPGSRGVHVGKIQTALNLVDDANLVEDSIYGAGTAAAVLAFKTKRNILGPGQKQPDNIVGKLTVAALDREVLAKERVPPRPKLLLGFKIDAGLHWGIDTAGPANFQVKNKNGQSKTLFDIVTEELTMPEFWGRYLFKGKDIAPLTKDEVEFIKKKSDGKCKILLIANFAGSQFNAIRAAEARLKGRSNAIVSNVHCGSRGLNVPGNVWIYADIEPEFQCNSNWFQGWFEEMQKARRGRGGLYVSPQQNPFSIPYRAALRATLDILSRGLNDDPPVFPPDLPHIARLLWSQQPVPFFKKDIDPNNFLPPAYAPLEPSAPGRPNFCPGMTAIWQYGGNCRVVPGNKNSIIDMNLATEQGFNSMWDLTK